jgi:hypothetical protein
MSNLVFPMLLPPDGSLLFPIKKFPKRSSIVQEPVSLRGDLGIGFAPYPVWMFELDFGAITGDEVTLNSGLQKIVGFCIQVGGRASTWLFQDPFDNAVVQMPFGVGDGTTTAFQLTRSIAGGIDIIQNLNGTPTIYNAGVATAAYSISATGVVTFNSPPAVNNVLSWTGGFYFRCRFLTDEPLSNLQRFVFKLWELKQLQFKSVIVP